MTLIEQLQQSPPAAASVSAPRGYSNGWVVALFCSDILMFMASAYGAVTLMSRLRHAPEHGVLISAAVSILIWIIVFQLAGLYQRSFALSMRDEFYCTVAALTVGIAPQVVLFTLVPSIATSRLVLLTSLILSIAAVGGSRALGHALRDTVNRRRPRRVTIVGQPDRIESALTSLNFAATDQILRLEADDIDDVVGLINISEDPRLDGIPWFRAAKQWNSDILILTEVVHPDLLPHLLEVAAQYRIKIAFAPPRLKRQAFSLSFETSGHQALIVPRPLRATSAPTMLVKRIFDLVFGSMMLLVFSPVMALVALLIWLGHDGPIFYRQTRVGLGGQFFDIFKFRTMPVAAETDTGPIWTQHGDSRATRLGTVLRRTSIDELPQLLNVLRGEMSMVGPRPERPMFVEVFRRYLPRYDERLLVPPGLTGWSHVQMKRNAPISDIAERLSHDLYYIENYSFLMDISIVVKTAAEFLFQRAA
jgi:putative colanic acid biosynthesis UDP-glucose lipid carrier transferase